METLGLQDVDIEKAGIIPFFESMEREQVDKHRRGLERQGAKVLGHNDVEVSDT